jgi:hypothetical protein
VQNRRLLVVKGSERRWRVRSRMMQIPTVLRDGDGGDGRKVICRVGERSFILTNLGNDEDGDEQAEKHGEDDEGGTSEVATTTKGKSHRCTKEEKTTTSR